MHHQYQIDHYVSSWCVLSWQPLVSILSFCNLLRADSSFLCHGTSDYKQTWWNATMSELLTELNIYGTMNEDWPKVHVWIIYVLINWYHWIIIKWVLEGTLKQTLNNDCVHGLLTVHMCVMLRVHYSWHGQEVFSPQQLYEIGPCTSLDVNSRHATAPSLSTKEKKVRGTTKLCIVQSNSKIRKSMGL